MLQPASHRNFQGIPARVVSFSILSGARWRFNPYAAAVNFNTARDDASTWQAYFTLAGCSRALGTGAQSAWWEGVFGGRFAPEAAGTGEEPGRCHGYPGAPQGIPVPG